MLIFKFSQEVNMFVSGEALTVLNLESEVHAAYQRAVKSCNPGKGFQFFCVNFRQVEQKMKTYPCLVQQRISGHYRTKNFTNMLRKWGKSTKHGKSFTCLLFNLLPVSEGLFQSNFSTDS